MYARSTINQSIPINQVTNTAVVFERWRAARCSSPRGGPRTVAYIEAGNAPRWEAVEEEGSPRSDCVDEEGSDAERNMVWSRSSCCCCRRCCSPCPCPCPCSSLLGRVGDVAPLPGADRVNHRLNILAGRRLYACGD